MIMGNIVLGVVVSGIIGWGKKMDGVIGIRIDTVVIGGDG